MKLMELIRWVSTFPDEFMQYDVVLSEINTWEEEDDDYKSRLHAPIVTMDVDEDSKEILLITKYV